MQCGESENLTKILKNLTDYLTNFVQKSDQNLTEIREKSDHTAPAETTYPEHSHHIDSHVSKRV